MTEGKIQAIASVFQASLFAVAGMAASNNLTLLVYLASGAVGGALLGALGGKKFGIFDLGVNTVLGKVAVHFSVVLGLGPALLEYVLHKYPAERTGISDTAMSCATGFMLSLCGTTLLIMLVPLLITWFKNFLILIKWLPPETKTTATSQSHSETSTAGLTSTTTRLPGSKD